MAMLARLLRGSCISDGLGMYTVHAQLVSWLFLPVLFAQKGSPRFFWPVALPGFAQLVLFCLCITRFPEFTFGWLSVEHCIIGMAVDLRSGVYPGQYER